MTQYINPSTRHDGANQIIVPERFTSAGMHEAPFDGQQHVRKDGEWVPITFSGVDPENLAGAEAGDFLVFNGTKWVPGKRSHTQIIFSGYTNTLGFRTLTHSAGWVPAGVTVTPLDPSGSFAVFWGADSFTSTTFRARFTHGSSGGPLNALTTGDLFVVLYE